MQTRRPLRSQKDDLKVWIAELEPFWRNRTQSMSPGHSLYRGFVDKCGKKKKLGRNFAKECSKSSKNVTNRKSVIFCSDLATRKIFQLFFHRKKMKFRTKYFLNFQWKIDFQQKEIPSVESRFFIEFGEFFFSKFRNYFFRWKKSWDFFRVAKSMQNFTLFRLVTFLELFEHSFTIFWPSTFFP